MRERHMGTGAFRRAGAWAGEKSDFLSILLVVRIIEHG